MELTPWKPFGGLGMLRKEMESLWDRFFNETQLTGDMTDTWLPALDISEGKDAFVVKIELPGMTEKDVNVSISGDLLTIKGEKKKEKQEKDEHFHRVEIHSGSFQRSFQLPSSVKADKIEASFDKGILKISLPKIEDAKKKDIKIQIK